MSGRSPIYVPRVVRRLHGGKSVHGIILLTACDGTAAVVRQLATLLAVCAAFSIDTVVQVFWSKSSEHQAQPMALSAFLARLE